MGKNDVGDRKKYITQLTTQLVLSGITPEVALATAKKTADLLDTEECPLKNINFVVG